MGRDKQLLPVDGQPMLLHTLAALAAADIAGVVLVTRAAILQQLDEARLAGVRIAYNEPPDAEMIDSVRIGLQSWQDVAEITPHDAFLVHPADQPGVSTADIDACIAAFRAAPSAIIVASRTGRRGHPLLFPAELAHFVQSPACDAGLRVLPRTYPDRVREVSCTSAGVTRDIDTNEDYEHFRQ
jgi:molybdenum cofactor cytidylyltransferase